jgi:hypothetical protein
MAKHIHETIVRYVDGELSDAEKIEMKEHLRDCHQCSDFLSFTSGLRDTLKEMAPHELAPDTACPKSETLVAFSAGQLDEKEAQLVRKHAVFCKECLEELDLLRQTTQAAGIRFAEAPLREMVEKTKEFFIDLGKTYGPQALAGSIRILTEQRVPARGDDSPAAISKVLEASVGDNAYSIEVGVTDDGSVSCDIAGVRTPATVPLRISLRSETKSEIFSTQSDKFGNSHFVVPRTSFPGDLLLVTLSLQDKELQFLLRVPETGTTA